MKPLSGYFEETAPKWVQEIIVNCIKEAGYSLEEGLTNQGIVNEIRMAISSLLHKLHLNIDKCIEAQIKLWDENHLLGCENDIKGIEYDAVEAPPPDPEAFEEPPGVDVFAFARAFKEFFDDLEKD
jgi:hypothetical protein